MKRCRGYYTNTAFTVYAICSVFLQKCKYNTNSEFTIFGDIINDLKNKHLRELLLKCVFIILVLNQHNSRNLYAQELLITGEIRPRTEYRDGYAKPLSSNNDPGIFTSQRTRLSIAWNSETLNTYITMQDARIFGQDSHAASTSTIGYMDYWNTPAVEGLLNYYGCMRLKITNNISAEVAYHQFYSNHALKSNGIDAGKNLGSELDILCIWKLNKWSTVQAGYCRYFENPTTLLAKGIPATTSIRVPQWVYVMFTFNPVFLTTSSTNY